MSKGFYNALQVLKRLTKFWGNRVKLLIPTYMDCGLSSRTDDTYQQIKDTIESLQLQGNTIYHNWVCHEEMPEYYSYCDVILCIGNFVESFSNVSVESLLCGTPVVCSNTSTYRTMPIHEFLYVVPYGAINETDIKGAYQIGMEPFWYVNHAKVDESKINRRVDCRIIREWKNLNNILLDLAK